MRFLIQMQEFIPVIKEEKLNDKDQLKRRYTWSCGDDKFHSPSSNYFNQSEQQNLYAKNICINIFQTGRSMLNEKNMQKQPRVNSIKEKIIQGLSIVLSHLNRFEDESRKMNQEYQKNILKQYLLRKRNENYQHLYHLDNYERELSKKQKKMLDEQSYLYKQTSDYEQIKNQKQQINNRKEARKEKEKEVEDLKWSHDQLKCRREFQLGQLKSQYHRENQVEKQIETKLKNLLQSLDEWKEKSFEWKQKISKQQRLCQDTKLKILQMKERIQKEGLMDERLRVENIKKIEEKQYQSQSLDFMEYCKRKQLKVSPYLYIQSLKQQIHRNKIFLIRMQSSKKQVNQRRGSEEQNHKKGSRINKDKTKDRIRNKIAFMKNKIENKCQHDNLNKKLKEQLSTEKKYLSRVEALQILLDEQMENKVERKIASKDLYKHNSGVKYLELQKRKDQNKTLIKSESQIKVRPDKKKQRSEQTFYKVKKKDNIGFILTLIYLLILVVVAFYYTRIKIWMLVNL